MIKEIDEIIKQYMVELKCLDITDDFTSYTYSRGKILKKRLFNLFLLKTIFNKKILFIKNNKISLWFLRDTIIIEYVCLNNRSSQFNKEFENFKKINNIFFICHNRIVDTDNDKITYQLTLKYYEQ